MSVDRCGSAATAWSDAGTPSCWTYTYRLDTVSTLSGGHLASRRVRPGRAEDGWPRAAAVAPGIREGANELEDTYLEVLVV